MKAVRPCRPAIELPAEADLRAAAPLILPQDVVASAPWQETAPSRQAIADRWRQRMTTFAAVGSGGFLGANARHYLGVWVAATWGAGFPWGTLLINLAGSFVLGLYLALVTERFAGRPTARLFLATGFLGAFTTFSTFSYETIQLVQGGAPLAALAYVAASLILGLAATVSGLLCAHAL